jgi:hypothetical protein
MEFNLMKISFRKDTSEIIATSPDFILSKATTNLLYESLSDNEFDNVPEIVGDDDHMILYFSSIPKDFQYYVDEMSAIANITIPSFNLWSK